MLNFHEIERIESKVNRVRQSTRHMPPARPTLLDKLEDLKDHLRAYIKGYTSSRELSDLCATTESKLGVSREKEGRVFERDFWENVRDSLDHAYEKTVGLPHLIREDEKMKETIEAFEKQLQEVINAVKAREIDPHGTQCIDVASESLRAVGNMKLQAKTITVHSKTKADSLLQEMERVIMEIRHWISITDKNAGEPSMQSTGVEAKIRAEETEAIRISRPPISIEKSFLSKKSGETQIITSDKP